MSVFQGKLREGRKLSLAMSGMGKSDVVFLIYEISSTPFFLSCGIFQELLREVARVRYYPAKTPRPSPPRISKQSINKWQIEKGKLMARD